MKLKNNTANTPMSKSPQDANGEKLTQCRKLSYAILTVLPKDLLFTTVRRMTVNSLKVLIHTIPA